MSRRRSKKHPDRDTNDLSLAELDQELRPARPISPSPINTRIEDRRRWVPAGTSAREALGRPARVVYKASRPRGNSLTKKASAAGVVTPRRKTGKASGFKSFRSKIEHPSFKDARHTIICIKRKSRREVLFAKNKTRRGARSKKHYSSFSNIRC